MDERFYRADAYRRSLDTEVVETGQADGRPWARVSGTIFHPEGGGQPADQGQLGSARVVDVQTAERGRVFHLLDRPVGRGPTTLTIDWDRRYDHMQQHTGQHVLTAVCQDRLGLATKAFHLGETYASIDLDAPALAADAMVELEDAVNVVIREARPVTSITVSPDELERLDVRTRGIPDDVGERVRLVRIDGIDLNTCGGTHVRNTAELQLCHLIGTERIRGLVRLKFAYGERVVAIFRAASAREAALKKLLGAAPEAFVDVTTAWDRDRRALARALKRTEQELAAALAAELAAEEGDPLVRHYPGRDAAFLSVLAERTLEREPTHTLVLFGDDGTAAFFLVAAGDAADHDATALGERVRDALGARGGGKGRRFQGRGPEARKIEDARRAIEGG